MKDRRVRKTEQAIQAAFAKLLSEKSMENITVKSLCETADINKSTFYLHYKDIYDCADRLRDTIVDELSAVFAPYNFADIINNFSAILENIMDIFEKNRELYMPYLKSPSLSASLCKMKQLILEKVLARVDDKDRSNGISRCTVSFVISGIISVLEQHEFAEINHQAILALADKVQNGFACHK
ncbi:TetR/AcrR family transcriptional regulator [Desulfosporosinus fructosivorans]|uniref:TetR/AcrR family transcriptional regulator n=1 Tax=Desulfosporosinus fructosivorans TaxID=2018669 RepID=A0A4Z0R564_9FIRM|nr:TetR/AcrR family transcriptional regulator [Desulfosporosinus fructosivorans]TGE37293.1 TetR/AcrR family transcriptional regulator [Desulfosporosinus fructosivorans]